MYVCSVCCVLGYGGGWSTGRHLEGGPALQVDKAVVFNLVSGDCGEDGSIQQMIDAYGIPRSGSGELASQVCYSKVDTSQHIKVRSVLSCSCVASM